MTSLHKSILPISNQKKKKTEQKFTGTGTHLIEILMSKT